MRSINKRILAASAAVLLTVGLASAASTGQTTSHNFVTPDTSHMEVTTNRHTLYDAETGKVVENRLDLEGFEKKISAGGLEIWYREETEGIRIVDTRSGYIWGGLEADKVDGMGDKWCNQANSMLTFEYYNEKDAEAKLTLADNGVTVKYDWKNNGLNAQVDAKKLGISFSFTMTVGDSSVTFAMDEGSVQEEGDYRLKCIYFVPFLGAVESPQVTGLIATTDEDGEDGEEDGETTSSETEPTGTDTDQLSAGTEDGAGDTSGDENGDAQNGAEEGDQNEDGENGGEADTPKEPVELMDGYIFVPDGPGALMRFRPVSSYIASFEKKIYGLDMGIDSLSEASDLGANRSNDFLVEAPQITMPVFGMVHGPRQNGYLAVVEDGTEYASIMATPGGMITNYNWVTARFDYRQKYTHPTTKDGQGVYKPQDSLNPVNPKITYYFLTGEEADYSGMAVKYRGMLQEQGVLSGQERKDETIPMMLNVLGADVKKGFLFNGLSVFTTVDQTKEMVQKLQEMGITNLSLVYEGWQNGGINGGKYGRLSTESKVGSLEEMRELAEMVNGQNGRFFLHLNPVTANEDQINLVNMSTTTLSRSLAKFVRPNNKVMYYESYVIKPHKIQEFLENAYTKLDGFNLSLDQLGYRLYADNTRGKEISRIGTKELFSNLVAEAKETRQVALDNPNQYLWNNVSEFYETPIVNSQYLFETDTVPFLQMVIKGSIDYYAPYANIGFYSTNSILKMIEYGTYPSFIAGAADNFELQDTPLQDLFSVNFDDWKDTIQTVYDKVSGALSATEGLQMEEHHMVATGVARITYSGGVTLYVNYNADDVQVDGVTVPAQHYLVERS